MEFLKVSSKSSPSSVAGAIAGMIKDGVHVEIQSVGAGAVNQAVKAIAIARGFLSPIGIEICCAPAFADIDIDGETRTAIRFAVEPRFLRGALHEEIDTRMQFDAAELQPAFPD
jgi:stage V sporulation protein S